MEDTSLWQLAELLCSWWPTTHAESGQPLCVTDSSVLIARVTAVMLSLEQREPKPEAGGTVNSNARESANLDNALHMVARFVTAVTTRVLQGLQTQHATCQYDIMFELEAESTPQRAAYRSECVPCSIMAESVTAIILQVLRLQQPPLDEGVRTVPGEKSLFAGLSPPTTLTCSSTHG